MGKSKRQRKDGAAGVMRSKGMQQPESALDLLSDELKEQLLGGSSDPGQLLILPGRKKASAASEGSPEGALEPVPELSKSQLRKLKQIQQKKERRDNVSQSLEQLNSSSISDAHLALLRPLHQRGVKETKKQRLKRALQLERAGVAPTEEQARELYRPRTAAKADQDKGSSSSGDDDDDDRDAKPSYKAPVVSLQPVVAPVAAAGNSDGSEDMEGGTDKEEEEEEGSEEGRARAARVVAAAREEIMKARQAAGITEDDADPVEKEQLAAAQRQAAAAAAEAAAVAAAGGRAAGLHRVVHITRPAEIQAARQGLPILAMEQEIIESVAAHDVVVLCGETGCGKTTQVPQFLLEAGYGCTAFPERAGCVGVTQPRRVAATSTAGRVAQELGGELGGTVGYQVRYDRQVGTGTRVKFMTDGILLRELQDDFLLRRYSVLLVDEAHERSLNTDLLLGMLSRVVPLRRKLCAQQRAAPGYRPDAPDAVHPLKLVIMSATLRTSDFVDNRKLFQAPPPVIEVPARQYPVTVHFSRRTDLTDYVGAAFRKVARIHRELPPGGVLVFVTGQREVEHLCSKLRAKFQGKPQHAQGTALPEQGGTAGKAGRANGVGIAAQVPAQLQEQAEEVGHDQYGDDLAEAAQSGSWETEKALKEMEDDYSEMNDSADEDEEEVQVLGGDCMTPEEIAEAEKRFEEALGVKVAPPPGANKQQPDEQGGPQPVHVLPLYAMLPAASQALVFQSAPPGHRLIVVATNVAETSLTIPGIRYVVDAGRSKQRLLEANAGGMARFEVRWVSQAAASQRAGRAGRTGPGHTYRLFSSAHYNDCMPLHTPPEIVNTALEGVLLVLKSMGVDKVHNFPFPSPPEPAALRSAEQCLLALCALDHKTGALTDVGRAMAAFPIGPRHARMLLEVAAWQLKLQGAATAAAAAAGARPPPSHVATLALPYAVALAAALAVESPFMHIDAVAKQSKSKGRDGTGPQEGDSSGDEEVSAAAYADREAGRAARQRQAQARQAHAALRVTGSDALSALRALCAYEATPAGERLGFCEEHHLHMRNLQEAEELHRQLLRVLAAPPAGALAAAGAAGPSLAVQLAALVAGQQAQDGMMQAVAAPRGAKFVSTAVQDCLRRAMAVGWADSVARRVRSAEQLSRQRQQEEAGAGGNGGSGKRHAVRYVSCAVANANVGGAGAGGVEARVAGAVQAGSGEDVSGDVFLHPRSSLHSTAPEYVTYTQLIQSARRPYMTGVTAVQAEWLVQSGSPLASWSPPSWTPPPCYRPTPTDAVMAWHDVGYGRHNWALPRCLRPHPEIKVAAMVLAAALLEGTVVQGLAEFRQAWVSTPSVASRPEMQGVARVGELVGALARHQVTSGRSLAARWSQQPSFLQRELLAWLPTAQQGRLVQQWAGLVGQAVQAAVQAGSGSGEGGEGAGDGAGVKNGRKTGQGKRQRAEGQAEEGGKVGRGSRDGLLGGLDSSLQGEGSVGQNGEGSRGQGQGGRGYGEAGSGSTGKKRRGEPAEVCAPHTVLGGARAATQLLPGKNKSKKHKHG